MPERDPNGDRALLEDAQQRPPRDAAEAVPARRDAASPHDDIDVVPVREVVGDRAKGGFVGGAEVLQRLVGEHHAPAERVVLAVALDDGDFVRWILLFHQQGKVQARRAATYANYLHSRSMGR